jgi:hypothetical protein
MVATCKWFFFSFFGENMPKVTLGKKIKTVFPCIGGVKKTLEISMSKMLKL